MSSKQWQNWIKSQRKWIKKIKYHKGQWDKTKHILEMYVIKTHVPPLITSCLVAGVTWGSWQGLVGIWPVPLWFYFHLACFNYYKNIKINSVHCLRYLSNVICDFDISPVFVLCLSLVNSDHECYSRQTTDHICTQCVHVCLSQK
jgi:hypothetical protein